MLPPHGMAENAIPLLGCLPASKYSAEGAAMTTTAQETELDAAIRLRRTIARLSRGLRPSQAATGLTPTKISVLVSVTIYGPLKLADLGAREGLNPTMLSRIVAQL